MDQFAFNKGDNKKPLILQDIKKLKNSCSHLNQPKAWLSIPSLRRVNVVTIIIHITSLTKALPGHEYLHEEVEKPVLSQEDRENNGQGSDPLQFHAPVSILIPFQLHIHWKTIKNIIFMPIQLGYLKSTLAADRIFIIKWMQILNFNTPVLYMFLKYFTIFLTHFNIMLTSLNYGKKEKHFANRLPEREVLFTSIMLEIYVHTKYFWNMWTEIENVKKLHTTL